MDYDERTLRRPPADGRRNAAGFAGLQGYQSDRPVPQRVAEPAASDVGAASALTARAVSGVLPRTHDHRSIDATPARARFSLLQVP
jgi:hypothetical protein